MNRNHSHILTFSSSMNYGCGFTIHYSQEFACHAVYAEVNQFCWKMTWQKWVLFMWTQIRCEATQRVMLAQLQSGMPCCGNRAVKGQEYLKLASSSPQPFYTMCYIRTASRFILIEQYWCVFSLVCSICSFHYLLPWCLHFPFIASPPSLVFSPDKSTSMKFTGRHPYANFCKLTKSTLFK